MLKAVLLIEHIRVFCKSSKANEEHFGEQISCSVLISNVQLEALWTEGVNRETEQPAGVVGEVLVSPVFGKGTSHHA